MRTLLRVGQALGDAIFALARGSGAIAALTVLAMCVLITADVIIRSTLNLPIVWVPEIVGYLMVALVFLDLGDSMLAGSHIKIDLLLNRLPKRSRDVLELLTLALSTGLAGFFTWHAWRTMLRSYDFGRKDAFGSLATPIYIPQLAMPIGLGILTLVLAVMVCRKFYAVRYNLKEEASVAPPIEFS